jgi:predicted anti-sigma-YlaC factor YlaD
MITRHLDDEQLDRHLCGEPLDVEAEEHLAGCLACRRRRDAFLAAVGASAGLDPSPEEREVVREAALRAFGGRRHAPAARWWLAAAAAVLVAVLVAVVRRPEPAVSLAEVDAVLEEVDAVLERDPLAAFGGSALVETVVPAKAAGERSAS